MRRELGVVASQEGKQSGNNFLGAVAAGSQRSGLLAVSGACQLFSQVQ